MGAYPDSFVWRADITKFFDNVNHNTLLALLTQKMNDSKALSILQEIISSRSVSDNVERESKPRRARHSYRELNKPNFRQHLSQRVGPLRYAYHSAVSLSALWG